LVVANFKEIQLQHMLSATLEISVDSYPDIPLKAHVQPASELVRASNCSLQKTRQATGEGRPAASGQDRL